MSNNERINVKFRNKLDEVEAFQMTRERRADNRDWPNWLNEAWNRDQSELGAVWATNGTDQLTIVLSFGTCLIDWGTWIIREPGGKLGLCSPDMFEKLFEAAGKPGMLSASEALYGFASWLTTRGARTIMSSADDASPIADLVDQFCRENNLEKPRDEWTRWLRHPK